MEGRVEAVEESEISSKSNKKEKRTQWQPNLSARPAYITQWSDAYVYICHPGRDADTRGCRGSGDAPGDRYLGHIKVSVIPKVGPTPYRARATVYSTYSGPVRRLRRACSFAVGSAGTSIYS